MAAPVIESLSAVQRDAAATFLVDISFSVSDPDADNLTPTLEWSSQGATGPWSAAGAQTVDFKHTSATPLTGIPVGSPGKAFLFVWNAFFDLGDGEFDIHVRLTVEDPGLSTDQQVFGPISVVTQLPDTDDDNTAKKLKRRAQIARAPIDFLGSGLLFPLRRGGSDLVLGSGIELVTASVHIILGTRASIGKLHGELRWRPDFGSKHWILKHRQLNPTTKSQARTFVREALGWEPRVEINEVFVENPAFAGPTELRVRTRFSVISNNVVDNRVSIPLVEVVETISVS